MSKPFPKNANDCLVHAVNFALRYPWLTDREQVLRLMQRRCHKTLQKVSRDKKMFGVPIEAFQEFFLFGSSAYSLRKIHEIHFPNHVQKLKTEILNNLLGQKAG